MNLKVLFLVLFAVLFFLIFLFPYEDDFPVLKGDYLGQKPPGLTPQIFAPGVICDSHTQGYPSFTVETKITFRADKLSDRVLFIKSGKSPVMSNMTAIATSRGLVVIDAHYKPACGHRIRQIIEEVFGRKDFTYLIYTHAGVDHMGGAVAFPEAVLIGHENCIDRIDGLREQLKSVDIREAMKPRLTLIQDKLDANPADSAEKIKLEEAMLYWSELTELMATGFEHPKPALSFADSMELHLDDVHIKLCYCTPGYSESDILIHVPEEKLLVVGDIFNKDRIPLISEKTDVRRWLDLFEPFAEGREEIRYIIGAHDELMTLSELKVRLDYLKDLWGGVMAARREGMSLEETKELFVFAQRFPHLSHLSTRWVSWPHDLHERNIEKIWEAAELRGPYLGQKPPGMIPEVFAPGIISTKASEGCSYFSTDQKLFVFVRGRSDQNGIFIMEQRDGLWSKPRLASFSAGKYDWDFAFAPDDKTIIVSSGRPIGKGGEPVRDYYLWKTKKAGDAWSEPVLLLPPVNTGQHDSYPCLTEDGTLYFFSNRDGGLGLGDIYKASRVNGQYPEVENLGAPINSEYHEVDAFVVPDESYMIFCSDRPGGLGKADLYVTFRKNDGSWTKPLNLGEKINSQYSEYIPSVSPDGKYFFFTTDKTGQRDIYWVDAKVIDDLKPDVLK